MNAVCRTMTLAAGLAFVLTLGACSGANGSDCKTNPTGPGCPPSPTPPPPACTQSVVESYTGVLEAKTLRFNDFSVPDSGRLDITLDWTNASSGIGLYVTPANTCTTVADFNARNCNFIVRSEPSGSKPRKISTAGFNAGNYRWLVGNFSTSDESISFQFVISKGSCAALTGGQPAASSAGDGMPAIERQIHF